MRVLSGSASETMTVTKTTTDDIALHVQCSCPKPLQPSFPLHVQRQRQQQQHNKTNNKINTPPHRYGTFQESTRPNVFTTTPLPKCPAPQQQQQQQQQPQPQTKPHTETPAAAWRRRLVQWDITHCGLPLACFGFTAMWESASACLPKPNMLTTVWNVSFLLSCLILLATLLIYIARVLIFPRAFLADFRHKFRINCFFMPVIIGCLAVLTAPQPLQTLRLFTNVFYLLSTYQLLLTFYVVGEWLSHYDVTENMHPMLFLQPIAFFILTTVGSYAGLLQPAWALFTLGCLMWLVIFALSIQNMARTLSERKQRAQATFFIFIGPPAQATFAAIVHSACTTAVAEATTTQTTLLSVSHSESWPALAESAYYIDIFLYVLMIRLLPCIVSQEFDITWWAYIFPMSAAATATMWRYQAVGGPLWATLCVLAAVLACVAMVIVSVFMTRSVLAGETPRNSICLKNYERYFKETRRTFLWRGPKDTPLPLHKS